MTTEDHPSSKFQKSEFTETTGKSFPEHIKIFEKGDMSVFFLFEYQTFSELETYWEDDHDNYLVPYYNKRTQNDISLAYNFYAIFFYGDEKSINPQLYSSIINNTSYSRKYIYQQNDDFLIPGTFPEIDDSKKSSTHFSALLSEQWKKQLGEKMYDIIDQHQGDKAELSAKFEQHLKDFLPAEHGNG